MQSGGLHSTWLPWLTLRAGTTRTWSPPTVGEQCLLLSPNGEPAAGVMLLGLYSAQHLSPSNSLDEQLCAFPDGAVIRYHRGSGALSARGVIGMHWPPTATCWRRLIESDGHRYMTAPINIPIA
ncbi:phage baseplate assembly protein V [Chitinivorax sp. B]|uniref:phage baseplate assembly protein V n=1 Tax=Chitinivorax sp. B TaxID=2502235 RepID=UPI00201700A5|nr:phage baseplate assembly protein V [Chitinivorax sp. B]